MKINHFTRLGLTALAAVAAFSLGACKKAPEGNTGDSGSGGGGSAAEPESAAPAGPTVAEQLVGYWAPDKASLTALMEEEVAGQFGGPGGPGEAMASKILGPMVDAMLEFFTFQLTGDKAFIVGPEGHEEQGSYKVVSTDEATGTFVVETTDIDSGEVDKAEGTVKNDQLTMTKDGDTMVMNRIDEAAFEARKEKAKSFNPQELLAPLMQELLGGAGGAAPGSAPPGLPPGIEIPDVPIPDEPN